MKNNVEYDLLQSIEDVDLEEFKDILNYPNIRNDFKKIVGNYGMIDLKTGTHITSENLQLPGIDWSNLASLHGVSDNVAQIKKKFKNALRSDEQYIITVNEIRKSEQSENGGWRWNKWGEYIGTQNSKCEYIADGPEIESVFCFHIHKVELKPALKPSTKPRIK